MDRMVAMEIYRAVVTSGSFARASELLHISAASTSRHISALEKHLGVTLLRRTTRAIVPTEIGEKYFVQCCDILDKLKTAESLAGDNKSQLSGRLRISLPTTFGLRYVAPLIPGFLQLYPEIETEICFTDRKIDFVDDGVDIAIRITRELNVALIAKKLGDVRLYASASPDYVQRRGAPTSPDDLRHHDCLTYAHAAYGDTWRFVKDEVEHLVPIKCNFRSNNGDMIRLACLSGRGIAIQPSFIIADDLRSGALVALLPEYQIASASAYAIYPVDGRGSARIHAFTEYISKAFKELSPAWTGGLNGRTRQRRNDNR